MNSVHTVKKKDVKITVRGSYLKIQIVYHVKEPFIGNLSVWVDFDDFIEVGVK